MNFDLDLPLADVLPYPEEVAYFEDRRVRTLLALIAVHQHGAPVTIDAVAAAVGWSRAVVYGNLQKLRSDGLVDWDRHQKGTLRPLVAPVRMAS